MRRITRLALACALLSVLALLPIDEAHALKGIEIGAKAYVWVGSLDGTSQTSFGPVIDFKDDLGVGDEEILAGEVFLAMKRHNFIVAYSAPSFSSDVIDKALEYDQIDGIYRYDLIKYNPAIASFYLGLLAQVKYVDGFVTVDTGGAREDFSAPIPMIGLGAGIGLLKDILILEARLAGLEISGDRAIDGEAMVGVFVFPFFKLFGGYKVFDLKVDESDVGVDATIDGPFAGIQFKF